MSVRESEFELPKDIERYLAMLSKIYVKENRKQLQEIIVNSQVKIHEGMSYDRWNGGTYGHALHLIVPEALYLDIVNQRGGIQKQIREDLEKVHNVQNEFIEEVFLEVETAEDQDWRKESGLLLDAKRVISPDTASRIWVNKEHYRLFLSHKAEFKEGAAELKERLLVYGISSFVAHEDIHPAKEWQDEIENALFSMNALVALMTERFHDSDWTDQEVGAAFVRGVPIIPVNLGKVPYGFIGKFQALSCSWDMVAKEIVKILLEKDRNPMMNTYINAVQNCDSYAHGNTLSEILPCINELNDQQVNNLISAFNENQQVSDSFGFSGKFSSLYGDGLAYHLKRLTGRTYGLSELGKIEVVS